MRFDVSMLSYEQLGYILGLDSIAQKIEFSETF